MTYEVRDKFNRTVIRAEVMKGDLHYRKNLEILIHVLAGLMNGENWIENGIDGYKVSGFGVGNAEQRIPFPGGDVNRKIAESIEKPVIEPKPEPVAVEETEKEDDDSGIVGGEKHEDIQGLRKKRR